MAPQRTGRPRVSNSLVKIKKEGLVKFRINFQVEKMYKSQLSKTNQVLYSKYLLQNGKTRICAIAYGNMAVQVDEILKEGKGFFINPEGVKAAKAKTKFSKFSLSTCKYDLTITDVSKIVTALPVESRRFSNQGNLSQMKQAIKASRSAQRNNFKKILKRVTISSGTVHRYFGCPHCYKSINRPSSPGKYVCQSKKSKCPKGSGKEVIRKLYFRISVGSVFINQFITSNVDIKISIGDHSIDGIVCFNEAAMKILEKSADSFSDDLEATELFQAKYSSGYFSMELRGTKSQYGWSLIAKNLEKHDENTVEESDTPETDGPDELITITSLSTARCRVQRRVGGYPINSTPAGLVLVISNREFKVKPGKKPIKPRLGAEKDEANIHALFTWLNYQVIPETDVTSCKLPEVIHNFQQKFMEQNLDSCIVFVLSHGILSKVTMADGVSIDYYEDIVYRFESGVCSQLEGKPKIFFFNICQDIVPLSQFDGQEATSSNNTRIKTVIPPTISPIDTFVCTSALPGRKSYRYPNSGSLFVAHLDKVFRENVPKRMELQKLMAELQVSVRNDQRKNQMPTYSPFVFGEFYFNLKTQAVRKVKLPGLENFARDLAQNNNAPDRRRVQ